MSDLALVGCLLLVSGGRAHALIECTNDDDCTADNMCGGKVCNWIGVDHLCQDATGAVHEGWCTTTADCKCKGVGATCVAPHCTFTVPVDLAGADFSPPPDLKQLPDLTPPPPDLLPPPDLFGVVFDMTSVPDLVTVDLSATPADLSATPADMAASTADMSSAIECDHDTQCPGTTCGGQVCRWTNTSQSCVAAGTDAQGTDGWCNNDDECKCKGEGATCNLSTLHCTATLPKTKGNSGCSVADPLSTGSLALSTMLALLLASGLGRRGRRLQ